MSEQRDVVTKSRGPRISDEPMDDDVVHPRIDESAGAGFVEEVMDDDPPPATVDDAPAEDGEDAPEDRRTLSDAEKLKRSRSEAKRLRREKAEDRDRVARLESRLEAYEQAQGKAQASHVEAQASQLEQQVAQARNLRKQSFADGDFEKAEQCSTFIENALVQIAQFKANKPQARQQPDQRRQEASWVKDWREQNDWFEDPDEPADTERAKEISRRIISGGVAADDPRHRAQLEKAIAREMPWRAQQERARGGRVVGGASRGGQPSPRAGGDYIPPFTLAAYQRGGIDTNDPKWRAEVRAKYGRQWDASFRGGNR